MSSCDCVSENDTEYTHDPGNTRGYLSSQPTGFFEISVLSAGNGYAILPYHLLTQWRKEDPVTHVVVRVRPMRLERGLSLRQLGHAIQMPYGTLGRKERGEHCWTLDELARCAQLFGVCLCQVITLEDDRRP